ncbi:MAG TPA: AraC family transcriptional regulator [Chitinophagaceae bacterium]
MKPVSEQLGDMFVHACTFEKTYVYEQFVPEHLLAYQVSGQTHIYHQRGEMVLEEGQVLLARRNQFAKSFKIPGKNKKYHCICVILTIERLRQFALNNGIVYEGKYEGKKNIILEPNDFLNGYLLSVLPYIEQWMNANKKLASIKVDEAVELILHLRPDLKAFLFDFADPYKQDLEAFMLKNFHYNVPIEHFARLSGRSLTSFKRDFAELFKTSPGTWLKNKRLSEAFYLIRQKSQKPKDIYLDLGFENLSHFYSSFKQKYGITPAQTKLQTIAG